MSVQSEYSVSFRVNRSSPYNFNFPFVSLVSSKNQNQYYKKI